MINAARKNRLPRLLNDTGAIGRPKAVGWARNEGLYAVCGGMGQAIELGQLDDPHTGHLHRRILCAEDGDLVGKPLPSKYSQCGRLS